ncbi:putative ATP-dependent RNA helicase TDRD12 isoform X1 [Choristoneura fumiferana]|uniref:putative ATP-dependent RNA helicase TDRD12 isoform X1 n=1 Tax=Choristoneura fumiferana TaxID=7141 RepID=UPI003D156732
MEPDWYHVEILHYLNPHLIWVKVRDRSPTGFSLEQIGVYGVLPLDVVPDIDSESVITSRCDTWQPAATLVMKKVLLEATECRFLPTHIDRRSSIFDSNIHKYGEILIRKADGKFRKLSDYLKRSSFAIYDEAAFHQELSGGLISKRLSKNTLDEVIKIITAAIDDNASEVALQKQTTVYQAAKKLEALTSDNLDRHNRNFKKLITGEDLMKVLDKKFKDLELCKDLEEESVGRATLSSKMRDNRQMFDKVEVNVRNASYIPEIDRADTKAIKRYDDFEEPVRDEDNPSKLDTDESMEMPVVYHDIPSSVNQGEAVYHARRKNVNQKKKSSKYKLPVYDSLTQKCVAYSPPGVNRMKLSYKVVPLVQEPVEIPKIDTEDEVLETKDDMFGEVDSDVNIHITNQEVLKKYVNNKENGKLEDVQMPEPSVAAKEPIKIDLTTKVDDSSSESHSLLKKYKMLQKKLRICNERKRQDSASSASNTTAKDTLSSDGKKEDSDDDVSEIVKQYKENNVATVITPKNDANKHLVNKTNNVNPFKNVDPNLSVFVDKLVNPVLMVHTKNNARIEPKSNLSDIPFNLNIHNALKNMKVQQPMTMQSVSWFSILRGLSVMLIGPKGCGKTMGYLPSVCRLVSDGDNDIVNSVGPTCIIVCATAKSVSEIEYKSKMLLSHKEKVFSCYAGMDLLNITMSLLNGCDLFICTPCVLVRLLVQTDFGVDLRRLTTFVLDDCERMDEVYQNEIRVILAKVKEMLKTRVNKEVKVQYVLASRVWCDFMEPLAKRAPNTVICIGAFQECVLYSKANTTVDFVMAGNKNTKALEFIKNNDRSKKTLVVCRKDEEVDELERVLTQQKYTVFACNSEMTVEDLRSLNTAWNDYADPLSGPILVCCDGNLNHMNITDAHYLLHYSMPELFSMFCKRFSALNDHYPSIFKTENESVSIKIILEDNNAEQLPKICNFVKRCTNEFPNMLNAVCQKILTCKDSVKAADLVPICGNLLALGECPDFWYCRERHTFSETHDEPKEWMPTDGTITFKILHYQTAVLYSARLLSNIKKGGTRKYLQTYSTLSLKMGMYFSQDANRKLHGIPKIGDVCAVSIKENFFVRCQVVDIINKYRTGNPNHVLIKLIDEEKLETSRDIYLYHLPKELKDIETYVVQVRLAGLVPKDKDITFSDLAKYQLTKAVDINEDVYMRGKVVMTVGNQIFVDNIYVCQDLSSLNEIVVKNNFKEMLEPHSVPFPDHIKMTKSSLLFDAEASTDNTDFEELEEVKPLKEVPKAQWAHLNREDLSLVYFTSAIDPSSFFVRLAKFEDTMVGLNKDIDKYLEEKPGPLLNVKENDIVLAKFPDNECFERARVDLISGNKAKIFFVDYGDWREVPLKHLIEIPDKFITRLPFQAIECRLIGVRPVGDNWTDFSTNWLCDRCDREILQELYVKHFSSDKADYTGGTKYAVVLIDTNDEENVVYNNLMIKLNLAAPIEDEMNILDNLDFTEATKSSKIEDEWSNVDEETPVTKDNKKSNQLLRSVPLMADDDSDSDRWSFNMPQEIMNAFKGAPTNDYKTKPESKSANSKSADVKPTDSNKIIIKTTKPKSKSADSPNDKVEKVSNEPMLSDYEVIAPPKIQELDSDDLSSAESQNTKSELLKEVSQGRKPKILWKQNKLDVTLKIMLIGVEKYEINFLERAIDFSANVNDTSYSFNFELYGVIDKNKCSHSNKGQYLLVKLVKLAQLNWLSLTRKSCVGKWIVYDVDSLDMSSDEEEVVVNNMAEIIKSYNKDDSDSDDEFWDDANYSYGRR